MSFISRIVHGIFTISEADAQEILSTLFKGLEAKVEAAI